MARLSMGWGWREKLGLWRGKRKIMHARIWIRLLGNDLLCIWWCSSPQQHWQMLIEREWMKRKIKREEVCDSDCREGFPPTGTQEALVSLDFVSQLVDNKFTTRSQCFLKKISLMNESSYHGSSYLKISCNATADISNQITQHLIPFHLKKSR